MSQSIDLSGNNIIVDGVYVGASTPGAAGTLLSGSEITVLDSVTPGTAAASKALVLNSSKGISTITSATITTATSTTTNTTTGNVGASGTAGTLNVFPTTASKGKIVVSAADSAGDTATTITNASQSGARTYTIPDGGASANFVLSTGTSTATTATSTELNTVSGVTAGTVIASKALVADSGIKINGLLNATFGAGTATVAPINLTSGTNLTTAAAGAIEFDGAAFYATSRASSRQLLHSEQFVVATANSATYNNTLLDTASAAPVFTTTTSGTSAGAVTLVAGKTYAFEFMYNLTNTGTTSHTWATSFAGGATFNAGSAYTVTGVTGVTASTPASGSLTGFISGATMSTAVVCTAASTSATEQVTITGSGVFSVNGAGTVIPSLKASARPGVSGTPGVVVLAGSYFRIWEMPTTAAVGNWS